MKDKSAQFQELVESAGSILVISHISPDPDALCSLLLMGTSLKANFSDKHIAMNSEELTGDLNFLESYKDIELQPLDVAIKRHEPELVIIVDAMNFLRCTRGDAAAISEQIKQMGTKLAIIDHHEPEGIEKRADIYINNGSPAATQDVYLLLFNQLELNKPAGYAQTAMLGIVSDTNRFMYQNPLHRQTFALVSDLIDAGASIEELENKRVRYSKDEMRVFAELANNVTTGNQYTYTFIGDEFKNRWFNSGKTTDELKLGCQIFVNDFIRNIDGNSWGFMVYPDLLAGTDIYSVSFRALTGYKDVAILAKKLGGGGHKPAAGAKFKASSVEEAIAKIKQIIQGSQ